MDDPHLTIKFMDDSRKVYQISMFRNELDLLELQLEEMYDYIDKFIIIESNKSHSGQPKELVFKNNKQKFDKYKDKILHLVCDFDAKEYLQYKQNHINKYGYDDYVSQHEEWMREWYQRDYGLLHSGIQFKDNDVLLSLDIDEIVNSKSLMEFLKRNQTITEPYRLEMHFMHYYLDTNIYSTDSGLDKNWYYPTLVQHSELKRFNNSLSFLRVLGYSEQYVIKDGGWHFTFLSDEVGIAYKASTFSHSGEERFKVSSQEVKIAIENLELFYEKDSVLKLRHFPIELLPDTVKNNIEKWGKFLKQKPVDIDTDSVLVVVAGHITDEEKKIHTLNLIDNLKKDKLNVCYVTHSPRYLEEISENVDFVFYDKNNLLIDNSDYLKNVHIFDDSSTEYGICTYHSSFAFGKFTGTVIASHCPALMILLKNAVEIANANKFKWIVFLEYDIEPPTLGFCNFIRDKIKSLTNENKKCILYPRPKNGFIYPGILMFDPSEIINHPIFLKEAWYTSVESWIRHWKLGFSETITESILEDVFHNNILEYSIEEDAQKYWNTDNYAKIHRYNSFQTAYQHMITLAPSKKDEAHALHLYIINTSESDLLEIMDLTVTNESKHTILYQIHNKMMERLEWYFDSINNYENTDVIRLTYKVRKLNKIIEHTEVYNLNYVENIYNHVRRIEFY